MTVAQVSASSLEEFAALVGTDDPVCVAGGRTQWDVGGLPVDGTREVVAPSGVLLHEPAEMIVRVRAGTTVAALNSVLAEGGQMVPLDPVDPTRATVGGVLAVGHSGLRRLRYGPVRDTVLEVRFVSAAGRLVKAGGPVVKNVTGFDLCRLLVGSLGTLGLLGEVVLRCQPVPSVSRWLQSVEPGSVDPFEVFSRLYRASSVLWDGRRVSVLLEGHPDDVEVQAREVLGPAFAEVGGAPELPVGGRLSLPPGALRDLRAAASAAASAGVEGRWLAQIGVGTVYASDPAALAAAVGTTWPRTLTPPVAKLHEELQRRFDPDGRLNPGRQVAPGTTA
ncbi:MAG: glycolate oxidase binding subunit [Acidimicrobiaceae bacterium]|nr:glycolate oxidase binding subunit [Acidimicrobiaceae bacterium]